MRYPIFPTWIGLLCIASTLHAARAPQSSAELLEQADLVVTGKVIKVETRSARSQVEKAFGNYDWHIDVSIKVESVEKGRGVQVGDEIVTRCFAIRSRKSMTEYMSLQAHDPIPATGQVVRAYLRDGTAGHEVLHPNGFASLDGSDLVPAPEVQSLSQGGFTYLLPTELLTPLGILLLSIVVLVALVRVVMKRVRRRHEPDFQASAEQA